MSGVKFFSKSARTGQQIRAQSLFSFAGVKTVGIALTTFLTNLVGVRRLVSKHFFFECRLTSAFGHAHAYRFACRLLFATGNQRYRDGAKYPENVVTGAKKHRNASKPDSPTPVNDNDAPRHRRGLAGLRERRPRAPPLRFEDSSGTFLRLSPNHRDSTAAIGAGVEKWPRILHLLGNRRQERAALGLTFGSPHFVAPKRCRASIGTK